MDLTKGDEMTAYDAILLQRSIAALAKDLKATIESATIGRWQRWNVDAPTGKTWVCEPGLHCLKAEWPVVNRAAKMAALRDLEERMSLLLENCQDADCENCFTRADSR